MHKCISYSQDNFVKNKPAVGHVYIEASVFYLLDFLYLSLLFGI
jgi:hypothetical protein